MIIVRCSWLLVACSLLAPRLASAEPVPAPARIVFLAGGRSHGPGEHEFHAGCMLLAKALNEQSGLPVKAEVIQGWPADSTVLDGAKAVVFYSDGTSVVGKGWEKTEALARAGTGLMFMHYAVHPSKADGEKYFRPWIGGAYEDGWSVNPHWVADIDTLPGHPVSRGVATPLRSFDEYYYNIRFRPNRGEVLDLATATPSRDRIVRYINMWNEHGVAGLGTKQTLMWGVERPDGGRGVGFTGGHYHRNWALDGFRTLVLNAIVWTAGLEVPAAGVKSLAVSEDDLNANLDDKGPNKPRIKALTAAEIDALEPAEIQTEREAKFPKLVPASQPATTLEPAKAAASAPSRPANTPGVLWRSGVVNAATPGRAVDFDIDLRGAKKIWLVVEDDGSFAMDWAAWVNPRFVGPGGEKLLTDIEWRSATAEWGQVRKDRNAAGGPIRVAGREERGIGTHATSVIEFDVPEGMTRLVGRGGHDDGGANQADGGSIVFAVHAAPPRAAEASATRLSGPVEPAEAVDTLGLPSGLAATLFAAEPLLSSPSDIDVDARGRVWLCEVTNYRGKKDTRPEGDRILVLEDTDGDGRADTQTVFHQGRDVDSALGICVIGEGPGRKVIVSCAPDVFVFHDDDGDLKADRKESLFTKTGVPQHDHSVHAFVVGPDGRLYFNFGNTGNALHDKDGKPVRDRFGNEVTDAGKPYRGGMVFRCKPDGTDLEVLGHNFRNNYEVAVDSLGSLWQSDNDDDGNKGVRINAVMEYGNYGYGDERTGAGWQAARTNIEAEIPKRHWHQNDPGVVPNLLQTGAGSPTGICVYEGTLLPERFRGSLIHCDAGPNVVRAYHVKPQGAGFTAESEAIVEGGDRWFRPSDVCVAPDGSLIVADWYDPGVGGHGMGDVQKGRIFRIAPTGSKWSVPAVDFTTTAAAVAALSSPNPCTRATAVDRIAKQPEEAAPLLENAFRSATDPRTKARLAWAAGMLPGQAAVATARFAASPDEAVRIVAIRLCRLTQGDVLGLVERLTADPSPAVRRECAIALRGLAGDRADRVWAALAARHKAGDRWEVEALGIGADSVSGFGGQSQWDGRLAAWLATVGDAWKSPPGREIVWRSRAAATPAMLCELIADPSVTTSESLAVTRSLDFQDAAGVVAAVRPAVKAFAAPEEKLRVILPELVARLDAGAAADPELAKRIDEAAGYVAGTQAFVNLVGRFGLRGRVGELLDLAAAEGTSETVAAAAVGTAVALGGDEAVKPRLAAADPTTLRLLAALGIRGDGRSMKLLEGLLASAGTKPELKPAAVAALARSQQGARSVVALAKAGTLTGGLLQAAAVAIAGSPWADIRQSAADVLPMPKAKGGALPPLADLLKRSGAADRGRAVFAGAGTCAKCHVVGSEGRNVGPNLSGIGAKLSRQALYESILAPSAAISHNYESYTALLDDGRAVTGLLVSQSPETVVIRGADGIDATLPAGEVDELIKQPVSLMPADLATALSAEELVDLVAWLETLKN